MDECSGTVPDNRPGSHPGTYGARYGFRHPYPGVAGAGTHQAVRVRTGPIRSVVRKVTDAERPRDRYGAPVTRARDRDSRAADPSTEEGPALRDAVAATERAAADEREAEAIRERLRSSGPTEIEADGVIGQHLLPGERVHALRRSAILREPGAHDGLGYGGTLYLTSERVVHLGQVAMSIQLIHIVETSVAGERLLLSLHNGEGLSVDCARPRSFRAELADAVRRARE